MRIKAALVISILLTTIIALLVGVAKIPATTSRRRRSSTRSASSTSARSSASLPIVTALLVIFAIMLTDFFDTMGTVTGVAAEAGLADPDGSVPGVGRALLVDSLAAVAGGAAGVSSNTTYIESAAGVADGGRTGLDLGDTGVLFLLAILLVADRAHRARRRPPRRRSSSSAT